MTNNFKTYFSIVKTKLRLVEDIRKHYGMVLAPRFNSFDFWQIDENKISEILAFFLDPHGRHEQGDRFLKLFFEELNINYPFDHPNDIFVKTERTTDKGRKIDIVISKKYDEYVMGIENKIYLETADQQNQIKDYLTYLSKISNDNYSLVYLSPKDKKISENSITENEREYYIKTNKLYLVTYEENLIPYLEKFSINSESDRVTSFLKDFKNKLNQMIMGEESNDEKKILSEYALENVDNLRIALKISHAVNDVKLRLKKKAEDQLYEISKELDITFNDLKFTPKKWRNHTIGFSYEKGGLLYGIIRKKLDENKPRFPEIENKMGGSWNVSFWWPMWQYFYRNIETSSDFWIDITNGKFKERAKTFVKVINDNFDNEKY